MARKGRGLSWGEQIRRLEASQKAAGRTQEEVAESLGVSARTLRRWKGRAERPSTLEGSDLKRVRDRQNYWQVKRPLKLIEKGVLPETLQQVAPPPAPGSLIDRAEFAFQFSTNDYPKVLEAIAAGRRLVFEVVVVLPDTFERFSETVTIDTDGLTPADVNRAFWRSARILTREFGSPETGVSIELNSIFSR